MARVKPLQYPLQCKYLLTRDSGANNSFSFIEGGSCGLMLGHTEERSSGLDIRLSMNLQENKHEDRIADPSIGVPSSLILHSTYPHCPKACRVLSRTWDIPMRKKKKCPG